MSSTVKPRKSYYSGEDLPDIYPLEFDIGVYNFTIRQGPVSMVADFTTVCKSPIFNQFIKDHYDSIDPMKFLSASPNPMVENYNHMGLTKDNQWKFGFIQRYLEAFKKPAPDTEDIDFIFKYLPPPTR